MLPAICTRYRIPYQMSLTRVTVPFVPTRYIAERAFGQLPSKMVLPVFFLLGFVVVSCRLPRTFALFFCIGRWMIGGSLMTSLVPCFCHLIVVQRFGSAGNRRKLFLCLCLSAFLFFQDYYFIPHSWGEDAWGLFYVLFLFPFFHTSLLCVVSAG